MKALIGRPSSPSLVLVVILAALVAAGTVLVLDRSLVRVLLGVLLIGNGVAILFIVGRRPGGTAALRRGKRSRRMRDPLPQAMVLTAIVISLGDNRVPARPGLPAVAAGDRRSTGRYRGCADPADGSRGRDVLHLRPIRVTDDHLRRAAEADAPWPPSSPTSCPCGAPAAARCSADPRRPAGPRAAAGHRRRRALAPSSPSPAPSST